MAKTAKNYDYELNKESFQLRCLRKDIYNGVKSKQTVFDVTTKVQKYQVSVENFILKFRKQLAKYEVKIWKNKIKSTVKDVKKYKNVFLVSKEITKASCRNDFSTQTSENEFNQIQDILENKKVEVETGLNASVQKLFDAMKMEETSSRKSSRSSFRK